VLGKLAIIHDERQTYDSAPAGLKNHRKKILIHDKLESKKVTRVNPLCWVI
jgi:hypothetical protein